MRDRYNTLLTQLVEKVLKGQLPSKEQVYRELVQDLEPDSAEILEQCLQEQLATTQAAVTNAVDEIRQANFVLEMGETPIAVPAGSVREQRIHEVA